LAIDDSGQGLLFHAVDSERADMVETALAAIDAAPYGRAKIAALEARTHIKGTALARCALWGRVDALQMLLDKLPLLDNNLLESEDAQGFRALHHACARGHERAAAMLLAAGALPDMPDKADRTPFTLAAETRCLPIMGALAAMGARIDRPNSRGLTPAMKAVSGKDGRALGELLRLGANPNARASADGSTLLGVAAADGWPRHLEALLAAGAQPNGDGEGDTPLMAATESQRLIPYAEILLVLIRAGADIDLPSASGKTPLEAALQRHDKSRAKALLAAGAHTESLTPSGLTLLEAQLLESSGAVKSFPDEPQAKLLLEAGAFVTPRLALAFIEGNGWSQSRLRDSTFIAMLRERALAQIESALLSESVPLSEHGAPSQRKPSL
jgi:ankyrin repeat protein